MNIFDWIEELDNRLMLRGYAKTPMQEEKLQKKARKAVQDMLRDDIDQNGGAIFDWIFTYYLPCEKPGLGLQVSGENGIDVYNGVRSRRRLLELPARGGKRFLHRCVRA